MRLWMVLGEQRGRNQNHGEGERGKESRAKDKWVEKEEDQRSKIKNKKQ